MENLSKISIAVDYREKPSGIYQKLIDLGVNTTIECLKAGDYIINNQIIIERKSKEDFILSLVQNRLFLQCANLKKTKYHQVILVEGNPYSTKHKIDRNAIKGALLSISLSWQIPIIFSTNTDDSVRMLIMAGEQNIKENQFFFTKRGYKPKNLRKQQLHFLQGLPKVGCKTVSALLEYFGSIENIVSARENDLVKIEGIGKNKAFQIKEFLQKSS